MTMVNLLRFPAPLLGRGSYTLRYSVMCKIALSFPHHACNVIRGYIFLFNLDLVAALAGWSVSKNNKFIWWTFVARILGSRGPFCQPINRGETYKAYVLALELFPKGPPICGKEWVVSTLEVGKFAQLDNLLFRRNG